MTFDSDDRSAVAATESPSVSIGVVRVSVSGPQPLGAAEFGVVSSIAKVAVSSVHLRLTELNLDGDDQSDREVHGGPDKAVYVYPSEHLAALEGTLAAEWHTPLAERLERAGPR